MANLSLGQAAKEAGVSKATLSKALKSGRLSYIAKTSSGYEIDPSELFRVFPRKPLQTVESERSETEGKPQVNTANIEFLHQEKELLRRENELLRLQLEDMRADRDAWRDQARDQVQRLLPSPEPKASFWSRLRGRSSS